MILSFMVTTFVYLCLLRVSAYKLVDVSGGRAYYNQPFKRVNNQTYVLEIYLFFKLVLISYKNLNFLRIAKAISYWEL